MNEAVHSFNHDYATPLWRAVVGAYGGLRLRSAWGELRNAVLFLYDISHPSPLYNSHGITLNQLSVVSEA